MNFTATATLQSRDKVKDTLFLLFYEKAAAVLQLFASICPSHLVQFSGCGSSYRVLVACNFLFDLSKLCINSTMVCFRIVDMIT
jgi:hypothetical protein